MSEQESTRETQRNQVFASSPAEGEPDTDADAVSRTIAFQSQLTALASNAKALADSISELRVISKQLSCELLDAEFNNERLSHLLSPSVVSQLTKNGDRMSVLEGRQYEVAVLFSDIRGSVELCARSGIDGTLAFLREYYGRMVSEVMHRDGTILHFAGDGLLAVFGAPDPSKGAADKAVAAGHAMQNALALANVDRQQLRLPVIRHGIGIHFGAAFVGTIGSPAKLEYTAIGHSVNVAQRIQTACKSLDRSFLISDAVKRRVSRRFSIKSMGRVALRGIRRPVALYSVEG